MSSCSYIDFRLEIDRTRNGRVVKESKCTATGTTNMTRRKPVGATMVGRNLASLVDITGQDISKSEKDRPLDQLQRGPES
jgi:hypothetical protein